MIREHKNIETILENLDTKRYPIPEHWPYKEARELFLNPNVTDPTTIEVQKDVLIAYLSLVTNIFSRTGLETNSRYFFFFFGSFIRLQIKWEAPDVEGLVEFLVRDKGFSEERVRKGCERLEKNLKTATQGRLDSFFTMKPSTTPSAGSKRKADEAAASAKGKKPAAKASGRGRPRK